MTDINRLCTVTAFSASMQIPVYDTNNGQPRKASGQQLVDFIQDNLDSDTPTPFRLYADTVVGLNASYPAAAWTGSVAYCTNGNSGAACLAVSDGTSWKRVALGATIA